MRRASSRSPSRSIRRPASGGSPSTSCCPSPSSSARFEREVIGERVRDKIAASKRKGIWVGGPVPLGYAATDKKVLVVPAEAETVCAIFTRHRRERCLGPGTHGADHRLVRVAGAARVVRSHGVRFCDAARVLGFATIPLMSLRSAGGAAISSGLLPGWEIG